MSRSQPLGSIALLPLAEQVKFYKVKPRFSCALLVASSRPVPGTAAWRLASYVICGCSATGPLQMPHRASPALVWSRRSLTDGVCVACVVLLCDRAQEQWEWASQLPPVFNALRALVYFHALKFGREQVCELCLRGVVACLACLRLPGLLFVVRAACGRRRCRVVCWMVAP